MKIVVLDYGLGNLKSLGWALNRIGHDYEVSNDPQVLSESDRLIVPGVGAFGQAIANIKSLGIQDLLKELILEHKIKTLGICLGMQILFEGSAESPGISGLSVLEGCFHRLNDEVSHVPHMGWNNLEYKDGIWPMYLVGVPEQTDFYFVHSYGLLETTIEQHWMTLRGEEEFVSYLECDNITCAQFHPEKSHSSGLKLLMNWVEN